MKQSHIATAIALCLAATVSHADIISQWNFNGASGTTAPSLGSGSAALIGTTATFASGNANGGSSDPDTSTSDWGWNLSGFASQGSGDLSRGAQFSISTVGWEQLSFSYDMRHSNTSARHEAVLVSTDGVTFTQVAQFSAVQQSDTWYNQRWVDLSTLAGAANNSQLQIRVVASFAPGTQGYDASTTGSSYSSTGTWRLDMVTLQGQVTAVPEPATYATLLLGLFSLGALSARARRR
ncbi:PEP-CTERM sorting domain-containing protein [Roseateles sp. BYS180W]|uniref:PEP-CTERM sorting domain-containing protein n=1 Tax=Roseateles rivi TaxID=3299028 RepID=A0ABW7FXG8_9BURK